jgi:putative sterol carrier protein
MSETAAQVKKIFEEMPSRLNTGATAGLDAVIQYQLTGEGGGKYYTHIQETSCVVQEGEHGAPRMTVIMEALDFVEMTQGRLDGMTAFMSGKLRIDGDMGLAMRMQSLFRG